MKIILKAGKEIAIKRKHPWIFSGAIAQMNDSLADGDLVEVLDHKKNYLATGHYYNGSIAVKLFAFQQESIDIAFWQQKLDIAIKLRSQILQSSSKTTNAYRLIHGEGDGLPGLILDYYKGVVVFQAHSIGMWRERLNIVEALKNIYNKALVAVYDKSSETLPENFAKDIRNTYLYGEAILPFEVSENNQKFLIDWISGQKTGFFLDQRDNRALLGIYAPGKKVLNAFCYSGGFSVYALAAGAALVHSVDASKKAIELVNQNIKHNFGDDKNHEAICADVMHYLRQNDQLYDLIVLDPPAYAKSISKRHQAVQGYKRLNAEGMKRLAKGGILFTFSCSQVVDRQLFYDTIVAAALEANRNVRVLHQLTQGADHPVNLFHPEGSYLKGLVLYVD